MEGKWKQSRCHVLNSGVWGASEALTPYLVRLNVHVVQSPLFRLAHSHSHLLL
jgi:hypothetical protein